jgi:quinolinate synthase
MNNRELTERILEQKQALGSRLTLLVHHYQRMELTDLADHIGDSFELSRAAAASKSELVVFCGVQFMAEAARVLVAPEQRVFIPDPRAGCPMADMVDGQDLAAAFAHLTEIWGQAPVPICYMNSSAEVKAFCGRNGGMVCTSSNAVRALKWGFSTGRPVLFIPDEFLGRNSAAHLGLNDFCVYDPHAPDGGLTPDELRAVSLVLWRGYCHVHVWFKPDHVLAARALYPEARILVHPECMPEVVALADGAGSTSYLVDCVRKAAPGEQFVIGTEVNLIKRLARDYPDRRVIPLDVSMCPNMYKTTLEKLWTVLDSFPACCEVFVPEDQARDARLALQRMLELK